MTMNRAGRGYLRLGLVQYYLPIAPQALLVGIALARIHRRTPMDGVRTAEEG